MTLACQASCKVFWGSQLLSLGFRTGLLALLPTIEYAGWIHEGPTPGTATGTGSGTGTVTGAGTEAGPAGGEAVAKAHPRLPREHRQSPHVRPAEGGRRLGIPQDEQEPTQVTRSFVMDSATDILLVIFGGVTAVVVLTSFVIATASKPIRRLENSLQETESRLNSRLDELQRGLAALSRIENAQADLLRSQQVLVSSLKEVLPGKVHGMLREATKSRDNIIRYEAAN